MADSLRSVRSGGPGSLVGAKIDVSRPQSWTRVSWLQLVGEPACDQRARTPVITLVMGGARAGKSALAERRVARSGRPVVYVATLLLSEADEDMQVRILRDRARRPMEWETLELGPGDDLTRVLDECPAELLVDSLGTWVAGFDGFEVSPEKLVSSLELRRKAGRGTVLVSDEVGLGVHPSTEPGRRFRDALGELNRAVAAVADEVFLAVAGRALLLPREDP